MGKMGDGICDCYLMIKECEFDRGDCENEDCTIVETCLVDYVLYSVGNGYCDEDLNNANCEYDRGDCE